MLRTYEYHSQLKPYIEGFIDQKRANGYNYEFETYIYTKFDEYCTENALTGNDLNKESLKDWMTTSRHLPKTAADRKFNDFWARTSFASTCDKKPTVHCLRHTFVVKRILPEWALVTVQTFLTDPWSIPAVH